MELRIEPARPEDVPLVLELIRELAEYEKEPESARATEGQIREALFGERPAAEAVIAWVDGEAAGWALWFQNFSTWTGKPGLWLEDLFVRPRFRRQGIGRALLAYLAGLCVERGYGRFEWSVLDWNTGAIEFYESLGAEAMGEWTTMRVSGEALRRLADR
ncbi:MAG TPA: GNAT family N-acetyltransferase [Dehalococcoidia bacterium]|jgi:GNAT superfamily N-acetyltransferase